MAGGIYQILNTANGMVYIGSAENIARRWRMHRCQLEKKSHANSYLQRAWSKYGSDKFLFSVMLVCSKDKLLLYEQRMINALSSVQNGYNILPTAGSALGYKHTPESLAKISAAHKGRKFSKETRAKMSASAKVKVFTAEHCSNISRGQTGKKMPEFSAAARANMSAAQMGKKATPEARAKMSASHKGRVFSPEHRAALSRSIKLAIAKKKQAKTLEL